MGSDKRPSPEVEMAIWGYVDPEPPIPGSWKGEVLERLGAYEIKHGQIPDEVVVAVRQWALKFVAEIEAALWYVEVGNGE